MTEYEAIREKSAIQKKDIERALNKFETKINDTDSLFLSPDTIFPGLYKMSMVYILLLADI